MQRVGNALLIAAFKHHHPPHSISEYMYMRDNWNIKLMHKWLARSGQIICTGYVVDTKLEFHDDHHYHVTIIFSLSIFIMLHNLWWQVIRMCVSLSCTFDALELLWSLFYTQIFSCILLSLPAHGKFTWSPQAGLEFHFVSGDKYQVMAFQNALATELHCYKTRVFKSPCSTTATATTTNSARIMPFKFVEGVSRSSEWKRLFCGDTRENILTD